MDSLPQELIDEIIDNLPRYSLHSASRVAKRWRRRSQQRLLSTVAFRSQGIVYGWYEQTKSDPGGISSYVQSAVFSKVYKWEEPALFSCVLKNFFSLTTLSISLTEIPDEVLESISHWGEFTHRITTLHLRWLRQCSLSGVILPMIFAFPNLQNLLLDRLSASPGELPQAYPVLQQRRLLDSLRVDGCKDQVTEAIADLQFTPRSLAVDVRTWSMQKLLVPLSMTLVELVLIDQPDTMITDWHIAHLPPFPALTSLGIHVPDTLTLHLIHALYSISSAPALASVTIEYTKKLPSKQYHPTWDSLDRWLVQMAENSTIDGDLVLTVVQTSWLTPTEFFPKFRRVGKVRRREINNWSKKRWDIGQHY